MPCLQVHDGEEFNTVAAGEDIGVNVTFRNPLQVKLALSRVRLHVQFTPADKATPGAAAPEASASVGAGGGVAVSPEDVLVMESQFSLHPGTGIPVRVLSLAIVAWVWEREFCSQSRGCSGHGVSCSLHSGRGG